MTDKQIRVAYQGKCYGPLLSLSLTVGQVLDILPVPKEILPTLGVRKIGTSKLWTVGQQESLPAGVYEVIPVPSYHNKDTSYMDKTSSSSSKLDLVRSKNAGPSQRYAQLCDYIIEDLASIVDQLGTSMAHLDASKKNPEKLQRIQNGFERVCKIHHFLPLLDSWKAGSTKVSSLTNLVTNLGSELWHVLHARAKLPPKGPKANYSNVTDYETPMNMTYAVHFANIAHSKRRIAEADGPLAWLSQMASGTGSTVPTATSPLPFPPHPAHQYQYQIHNHKPETNRLMKQYGLLPDDKGQMSMLTEKEIPLDKAVSQLRVRLIDSMLTTGLYKSGDVRKLLDSLLVLESKRMHGHHGSSHCHGHLYRYPTEEVARVLYREFQLTGDAK